MYNDDPVTAPATAPLPEGATFTTAPTAKSNRVFRRPQAPLLGETHEPTDAIPAAPFKAAAIKEAIRKVNAKAKTKPIVKAKAKRRGKVTRYTIESAKPAKAPKIKAKKRGGRTPKPPGEAFNNVVPLRLNDGDYAKLQLVAQRQGMPLAACARGVMLVGLGTFRVRSASKK